MLHDEIEFIKLTNVPETYRHDLGVRLLREVMTEEEVQDIIRRGRV